MRTCFHLPAVLTTLANRASPSEVPAAPPAVTSTRSQSGTKQQPAACCRALLLIVQGSSVRCLSRDARSGGYAVARGCRENRGTRLFRKRAAHIYDDLSLTGETTEQHQGSTSSNSNRR